jgi:YihY family inner membrane protein
MTNLIIEISKYFMIFMFAFYTYECFAAFRQKIKPEQREHILSRQCAAIFLIHFDAFAVIYLVTENISILVFYAAQAVLLAMIQTCYQLFYSRSSRLLTNNLCMLLTIGFIMLTRLSFDSARKQYFIALVSMIFSLIIPVLINRVGFVRKLYWLFAIVGILALLVVTIAGNTSYGAKISLSIAGISIQPSEFVKILFVFFDIIFTMLPNKKLTFKSQIPGAAICAVAWYVFSFALSIYVDYFNGFSMYGSLTTIALIMLWLYFCMYIMMMSAEVNVIFNESFRKWLKRDRTKKKRVEF